MRCGKCNRTIKRPYGSVLIEFDGRLAPLGPICAQRLRGLKPAREVRRESMARASDFSLQADWIAQMEAA